MFQGRGSFISFISSSCSPLLILWQCWEWHCNRHCPPNFVRYNQIMSRSALITGDQLTSALHELGVHFILGKQSTDNALNNHPARLIAALAESDEARLRLSLIPLFLEHPEFADYVRTAAKNLKLSARLTLQYYYTAAVWLGQKYQPLIKNSMLYSL